ncbi:MAG: hypothetical protein GVY07_07320 [Bacteroidetes bacterium]|nr:hypothetical protein [Bacteroidota bacterium]
MTNSNQPTNQPTNHKTYREALEVLSPREVEVLNLVEKGKTNREIAEELTLSVRTIHAHRRKICNKLSITGRNGLVKWLWWAKNGKN